MSMIMPERSNKPEEFFEIPEETSYASLGLQASAAGKEKEVIKDAVAGSNLAEEKGKRGLNNNSVALPRAQSNSQNIINKRLEVVKEPQSSVFAGSALSTPPTDQSRREITDLIPDFANATVNERFHLIIQQLGLTPSLEQPVIIGVTSSVRGEGRTTVALGLANAISQQTPLPVLLVEADIAQPTLAANLELTNRGLCEYLRAELPLYCNTLNDLDILFAGEANGESLRTLRSSRLDNLFNELTSLYAVIVVDLPPLAMTAESGRILNQVDRVLMVAQAGTTPSQLVKAALGLIPEEKRAGVVLNRTRPAFGPFNWLARLFHKVV